MGLFSNLPVRAELPAAGGDRRQRNADGAFWSPTRGTYQGLMADPSLLPQGVSLYSQYDDLGGANPWDLIDTSGELGTGNLQAGSIPKWLRDLGGRAGPAITPGNVAFETFNPQLGRQDYFYTTEGLGARDGDANNPGGLVDPDNFKRLAWSPLIVEASRTGDWSILNGMPYDVLDRSGNVIGQKLIEGMGQEDNTDQMVGMAAATLATMGAAGMLGGGAAAGSAGGAGAGTVGTAGAAGASGAAPSLTGTAFFGNASMPMAGASGFGGATGSMAGFGGIGSGLGYGATLEGAMGALGAAGAAGGTAAMGSGGFTPNYAADITGGFTGMPPAGSGFSSGLPIPEGMPLATSYGTGTGGLDAALAGFGATAGAAGSTGAEVGGTAATAGKSLLPQTAKDWLGLGSTAIGALSGAMGQEGESATSTQQLPSFLQGPVQGDLIPRTMGLLSDQAPAARTMGAQMTNLGGDLLRRGVAGNGFGSVTLDSPTTATNPYLSGVADDMQRRTQEMLAQNNLSIQGNSVASGGLGGSRQGVAQGIAAGKAADYLQGNLAGLYSGAYNADQGRALQKYGMDQSFFGQQRGQDLAQVSTGAGLLSGGLDTAWQPLKNANSVYGTYSPFGSRTTSTPDSGGGLQGLLGGALAGASFAQQAGWWK
jgi:hypothetical protein